MKSVKESTLISIYGDESADSRGERVYAVAALHGTQELWEKLRTLWRERLGGKIFHAADCESGYGDFRGIPEDVRHTLHLDLTSILAASGFVGWGVAIDLKGCKSVFPDALPEHHACSCFLRTIIHHTDKVLADYPNRPMTIAFDRNKKMEHNSRLVFKYLAEETKPGDKQWLPAAPDFVSREEIGVQAGDIWARELMKHVDGLLFRGDSYRPREQSVILGRTKRFSGDLLHGSMFQSMKDQMATLETSTGMSGEKYFAWLRQRKRQDNEWNRLEYMMYSAAKDRGLAGNQTASNVNFGESSAQKRSTKASALPPKSKNDDNGNPKARIVFDTSGLNRLVKSENGRSVVEKLLVDRYMPISETSVSELSGTKDAEIRKRLADTCEQLLVSGECLVPHHEVMHQMADCHWRRKERFKWEEVEIQAKELERELRTREFLSDDRMAAESREFAKAQKKRLKDIFNDAKEKFKDSFPDETKEMTLEEFIRIYKADGGPYWKSVSGFYEKTNIFPLSEDDAKQFIERCPPYHAITLGIATAHYQYGLPRDAKAEYDAGPFDLFMAVYLPYADVFVTDDPGQTNVMRAIASEVGLPVRISCYDDFAEDLLKG